MPGASSRGRVPGPHLLRQAWRMTLRDWRAGELTTLLLALVLAVAALSSVSFLAERMHGGLDRDARQMLGADLVVRADHPVPPEFAAKAHALGLRTAATAIFPSMVTTAAGAASNSHLGALKAVTAGYPLRGAVRIAPAANAPDHAASGIPAPGTVWVDPNLLDALKIPVGSSVMLGKRTFRVAAVITRELDRGFAFIDFSPRVMLRQDELASTGLIAYGSRVTYRLLVAGPAAALAQYATWAHGRVGGGKLRGVALESLRDGQPQLRQTLARAHHFLALVALLSALLAAVAIAMAAHRFMRRHLDGGAVMRCFGLSQRDLRILFAAEFLLLGVAGSLAGVALGFGAHMLMLHWLAGLINATLPPPTLWPVAQGVASGLVLLLGFALPPLLPLTRVPPARVLRREWGDAGRPAWLAYAFGLVLFGALLVSAAGDWKLGGIVAGGFALGLVVFGGVARAALWALARVARTDAGAAGGTGGAALGWRYAMVSLERRGAASALQITALSIGLMCLLLLAMTRNDLIAGWRKSTPPDAPNQFVIDIQPEQVAPLAQYLAAHGLADVTMEPMIRGRLIAIDGKPVNPDEFADANTKRLVDREFNLSYTSVLPSANRIVAGRWYGAGSQAQISIEQGLAKALKVGPGDVLRFDVAGQQIEAPISSVRKLDWGSFRVNFFVLMPPAALRDFPTTFITSFHLPAGRQALIDGLSRQFPGLTIIDVGAVLAQLQHVLEQVIAAVQFLFLFTLGAGLLVLYAALAGTRDERMRESALLRALGASQRQVIAVQAAEFAVVGALAGLMAACGAQAIGALLASRVFDFYLAINPWLPLAGLATGVACAAGGGWLGLRKVLRQPVLQSLRDA